MKKSILAAFLAVALAASSTASASMNAYLTLTARKAGPIKGSVVQKGREGKIEIIASEHRVQNANGKKQHGVFVITKEVDASSPLLYQVMVSNDVLSDFTLQYYQPSTSAVGGAGSEVQFYSVKLTNAHITEIKLKMPNNKNPELMKLPTTEEVSFAYDSISWTESGATTTDSGKGS